jgi:hypothetical protein
LTRRFSVPDLVLPSKIHGSPSGRRGSSIITEKRPPLWTSQPDSVLFRCPPPALSYDESPSRAIQGSSDSARFDHQGPRPINESDSSKNCRRKPITSITEKLISIKDKIRRLSSHCRRTSIEPVRTVEEAPIWTDLFSLDLPIEISQDKSEEDYLRRTQMEEVLEVLKQRLFARTKLEEVVTISAKITHNTASNEPSAQMQQMTVQYQQTVESNKPQSHAERKDSGVSVEA